MKNILRVLIILAATVTVVACGNDELDFRSVLHIETGEVLSLGDPVERFNEVLGEPWIEERNGMTLYRYDQITVNIHDGKAVGIMEFGGFMDMDNIFRFSDVSFETTEAELKEYFTLREFGTSGTMYTRSYDVRGNVVIADEDTVYFVQVTVHPTTRELDTIMIGRVPPVE